MTRLAHSIAYAILAIYFLWAALSGGQDLVFLKRAIGCGLAMLVVATFVTVISPAVNPNIIVIKDEESPYPTLV